MLRSRLILAGLAAALALAACHPADRLADTSDAASPGGGAPCGGIADPRCPDGHYCWKSPKAARGADMRGQCRAQPASCPPGHHPVCGADLKTYETPCLAAMNGANVMAEGACPAR